MSKLNVENIVASYGEGCDVLHGISFLLASGQVMLISGNNGSGKSTLLRAVAGLIPFSSGSITWNDQEVSNGLPGKAIHSWIGLMLQGDNIFPGLPVSENIELASGRLSKRIHKKDTKKRVNNMFPFLEDFWDKRAGLLSGGERKILSFAMATIADSPLLLLDEPLAGLSDENTNKVGKALKRHKESGKLMIIVEHSSTRIIDGLVDVYAEMSEGKFFVKK
jgi:branched-chain amino acid transport system ATP-binding protein